MEHEPLPDRIPDPQPIMLNDWPPTPLWKRVLGWAGLTALVALVVIGAGNTEAQAPSTTDHYIRYLVADSDEDGTGVWFYSGFGVPTAFAGTEGDRYIDAGGSGGPANKGELYWVNSDGNIESWELIYTSAATAELHTIATTGDGSPATLTLTPEWYRYVEIDCNDPDTCDVTMGETNVDEGMLVTITMIDATQTTDFADTAGVSELAGVFAAGQYDTLTLIYAGDRWVEVHRSDN